MQYTNVYEFSKGVWTYSYCKADKSNVIGQGAQLHKNAL
jgi:hypothetical protein